MALFLGAFCLSAPQLLRAAEAPPALPAIPAAGPTGASPGPPGGRPASPARPAPTGGVAQATAPGLPSATKVETPRPVPITPPAGLTNLGPGAARRFTRTATNLADPTRAPVALGTATNVPPSAVLTGAPAPTVVTRPALAVTNPAASATPPALSAATNVSTALAATNLAPRTTPFRGASNAPPRGAGFPEFPIPPAPAPRAAVPAGAATLPPQAVALGATNVVAADANAPLKADGDIIRKGMLAFQSMSLEQVLVAYAELTGRTVLRPNTLPQVSITLKSQTDLTKSEALQALDSVLTLNGITMIPVGEKFVTAVPSQQALTEAAAFSSVDPEDLPEAGQFLTKIVKLKHAFPTEVQPLVQQFSKVQNGIIPIDSTQTLILRDYAANIKRMTEIIDQVDIEVESDYKLEVIPIKYWEVEQIYSTMSSVIGGGGGGAGFAGGAASTGLGRARTTGGTRSSSRGMRGSATGGSRTGGLVGGRQQMGTGQFQTQAQQQPQQAGQTSFNQRLQQLVRNAAGGGAELLGDARIVPDTHANSLIVFASREDMQMITNIVAKVDRPLAQVVIEAIIMDVKLTDNYELGISAAMSPQRSGRLTSVLGMNNGQALLSGVTNLGSGLPSGFSYFGKYGGDLDFAVKALAANGKGQVLQTPRIQTSHGVPASFFTGETVPYVTSTYYGGYGGYGPSSSFQQLEVGIGLNVTPYITPDGLVVMDITQTIEEISGSTEISGVGKVPNTSRREATSTVSVQDGDTILLGGYIRTSKSRTKSGVPLLKDIPLLGALFRSESRDNARSELIVFLRPTVLATPRDAAILAKGEKQRLPGIREMEREMEKDEVARQEKSDRATGKKPAKRKK